MASATQVVGRHVNTSPAYSRQLRVFAVTALVTLFGLIVLIAFLMPFGYMAVTSIKDFDQIVASARGPVLPMDAVMVEVDGTQRELLNVPMDGGTRQLAIIQKGRQSSTFVDPDDPTAEPIVWEGAWRTLDPVYEFAPRWGNFAQVWTQIRFPKMLFNTAFIALMGTIGTLLSCIAVAYAFARFPIPYKSTLFLVLVGTIILPKQVLLVPTYAFFDLINWTGTWLPLIVPHFFANAYNVFLLRQFFMTLPRELDEAAMIDGAGPFRVLRSVIIPQSWAAIISVGLFHFIWSWNDYFGPLLYLLNNRDLQPISVGVQQFNFQYGPHPELIQATSLMAMVLPLVIFFLAQRIFMRGVVITGVEK